MPATLRAMGPLVEQQGSNSKHHPANIGTTAQLLVAVGTNEAGKTYSLLREQRDETQGLAFRVVDGLFRQSQHIRGKFAVNLSVLEVTQPKNSAKEQECVIHDLLQTTSKKSIEHIEAKMP